MEVNKELFEYIKEKYIENINHAQEQVVKYKELLDSYHPKFGCREYILDRYIYHRTAIEIMTIFLKDLEALEGLNEN